jgi:hypothetical protein
MPQFLGDEATGSLMQVKKDETYMAYLEEYMSVEHRPILGKRHDVEERQKNM